MQVCVGFGVFYNLFCYWIVEEKAVPKEVEGNEAPAQPSDEPEEEKDIDNTAESSKKSLEAEAFQETLDFREGDFREVLAGNP